MAEKKHDRRLDNPAFRQAHKAVCHVVHEIDRTEWKRIPQLRAAAAAGEKAAKELLDRYEKAMAERRATTRKVA